MKSCIFVSLTTNVFSYTVADLFYQLKEQYPEISKVIVHFWDIQLKHETLPKNEEENNIKDQNEEFLGTLSRFLQSLGLEHLIISYSDSRDRIFKSEKLTADFYSILTQISLDAVNLAYQKYEYLSKRPTDLGRLVHLVISLITCSEFEKLFPEFKTKVTDYFTSKRLIPVYDALKDTLFWQESLKLIKVKYAKTRPIIEYQIPSHYLNPNSSRDFIESQIRSEFAIEMDKRKVIDFLDILEIGNDGKIIFENKEIQLLSQDISRIHKYSKEEIIQLLTNNFMIYFNTIKSRIEKINPHQISKTVYITNARELDTILEFTNSIKYSILKLCTGKNTAEAIADLLRLKRSTVQNYLSSLKSKGIITKEKMPKRRVDRIILQFD